MKIRISDTFSNEDIENLNCVAFVATLAMIIVATIWRIFVC